MPARGEIGFEFEHGHDVAGIVAAPIVPAPLRRFARPGLGQKGDDAAFAQVALDGQRRAVAQAGDDFGRRIGRRAPVLRGGKIALDQDRADKAVALAGKDREDRMIGHFDVGNLLGPIDQQFGHADQRQRETALRRRDTDVC